jgi:beta,beta-carotene 9',10'-dioxygenase
VNAYENNQQKDNPQIILDIVTYPNADIISNISEHGYLSNKVGENSERLIQTRLMRYCLSPSQGSLESTALYTGSFELPRINENYTAYSYHYVYGSDQRSLEKPSDLRPLFKINTQTRKTVLWQEPGVLPGEPVFIPRPGAKDEDEGIVVTVVLDDRQHKAFLLMLDAKTFKEVGRAYAPFAIPVGLHGQFW